jgi:opine dehydrogenase
MNVAVLGGGNGAFAAAGDLTLRGHRVALCEHPAVPAGIADLRRTRTLLVAALPSTGLPSGQATLACVTDDPVTALAGAELVLVIVPSYAQDPFARLIARVLRPDQPVLLMPGNLWGGYRFSACLGDGGAVPDVFVGEAECMVYAARKTGPAGVEIRGYKHHLGIAAASPARSAEVLQRVRAVYPTVRAAEGVIAAGLNNVNPFLHPVILLSNLGLAGLPEARRFYADGVSRHVAQLIEALDEERLQVAAAAGEGVPPLRELLLRWYGHEGARGDSLYEVIHSVPAYQHSLFPPDPSSSRYLLEDVPFGLLPFLRLASRVGVAVPHTAALAAHASAVVESLGASFPAAEPEPEEWLRRARLRRPPVGRTHGDG